MPRALVTAALLVSACVSSPPSVVGPARESGQSALMNQTLAGKGSCDPENHLRPFVIEWDATDLSSFEARASSDLVFVRYVGCKLEVLDECSNESIRGSLGSYGAVTWTSGALESVDIQSELELYAKLPLGVASLGGRVASGEKFHMEYFVGGTRKSTRAAVYSKDLEAVPGCRGATHFVHAYQLGAFVLGSLTRAQAEAGATLWGIGGGVGGQYKSAVEKRGGVLEACRAESAQEVQTCRTPIRLTLRSVTEGENPDRVAAVAPETPDALNLAGKLQAASERSSQAGEHTRAATDKLNAGDGRGCLKELDAADRLQTKGGDLSTEPSSYLAMIRARCLMEAGQCEPGKVLLRKAQERMSQAMSPEQLDRSVETFVGMHCKGTTSPRDRLIRALFVLTEGAYQKRLDPKVCEEQVEAALSVLPSLKASGSGDDTVHQAPRRLLDMAPRCLARAGDCAKAYGAFRRVSPVVAKSESAKWFEEPRSVDMFTSTVRAECIQKPIPKMPPLEALIRSYAELEIREVGTEWPSGACQKSMDAGLAAFRSMKEPDQDAKRALRELRENGVECLAKAGDCESAYARVKSMWTLEDPERRHPLADLRAFHDEARDCTTYRPKSLSLEESMNWIFLRIERESRAEKPNAQLCSTLWQEMKQGVKPEHVDTAKNKLFNVTSRQASSCMGKGGDCKGSWLAWQDYVRVTSGRETPDRAAFEREHPGCVGK